MTVNRRTRRSDASDHARKRRTQAERRRHTRQALLDAALLQIEAGHSFDSLSLRSVARAAGVVPAAFYRQLAKEYQHKRDRFCAALAQAGLAPAVPQGAYYVLADARRLPGKNGKDRAMHVLKTTGVAGVPGEAFFSGRDGSRYIRFSYAKTDADLDEACQRIARLS